MHPVDIGRTAQRLKVESKHNGALSSSPVGHIGGLKLAPRNVRS
jgi:hypothetical protein